MSWDWANLSLDFALAAIKEIASTHSGKVTLDNMYTWLTEVDERAKPELRLKGISYARSFNRLRIPKLRDDFTVSMPWGAWEDKDKKDFPAPLQKAMIDVIDKGKEWTYSSKYPYIDIASLKPEQKFFTESGANQRSPRAALVDFIDSCEPDKFPVIRFLIGDEAGKTRQEMWWKTEAVFKDMFWPGGQPLVKHENARIYVGYYNPNFKMESETHAKEFYTKLLEMVQKRFPSIKQLIKDSEKEIEEAAVKFMTDGMPAITWNHGKVLSVNRIIMMTGGGNYWDDYSATGDPNHDIFDHQVPIFGEAALSAHQWCDYFWKYLSEPVASDTNSVAFGARLSKPLHWYTRSSEDKGQSGGVLEVDGSLPKEVQTCPPAADGEIPEYNNSPDKVPVLTVAKLGDWYGPMEKIKYPVMIMDMMRDMALNVYWQYNVEDKDDKTTPLGERMWRWNKILGDEVLSRTGIMNDFGINPVAWASRYTRNEAVAHATKSVVICQQMLVQNLTASSDDAKQFQKLVQSINDKLILKSKGDTKTEGKEWNGHVWPFDLMIAIAQALGTIYNLTDGGVKIEPENMDDPTSFTGVYIVLTTKKANHDRRKSWDDRTSIGLIKRRIRRIMEGLPEYAGGLGNRAQVAGAITKFLKFKRVGKDDGNLFSHSKIVSVDQRLMYVGSDNAYPCYNEEHGVWVQDPKEVEIWESKFFKKYWLEESVRPQGEDNNTL